MLTPPKVASLSASGLCRWSLRAPKATQVELRLYGSDGEPLRQPMTRSVDGYHSCERTGVVVGQRYAFQLDSGLVRPDPASLWPPEGVHAPSAVWRPDAFRWTDAAWKCPPALRSQVMSCASVRSTRKARGVRQLRLDRGTSRPQRASHV